MCNYARASTANTTTTTTKLKRNIACVGKSKPSPDHMCTPQLLSCDGGRRSPKLGHCVCVRACVLCGQTEFVANTRGSNFPRACVLLLSDVINISIERKIIRSNSLRCCFRPRGIGNKSVQSWPGALIIKSNFQHEPQAPRENPDTEKHAKSATIFQVAM